MSSTKPFILNFRIELSTNSVNSLRI